MPTTISRKICQRIVERYVTSRRDLCALSITNKLLREVTLPFLFRYLRFDGMLPDPQLIRSDEEEDGIGIGINYDIIFQSLVNNYRRVYKRIEGLKNNSHLLNYVTGLEIRGWSSLNALMDEDPDICHGPEFCLVQDSWMTAYDILGGLIRDDLPSLETLSIIFSPISRALQHTFYLSRRLEKIFLYGCQIDLTPSTIRRPQILTRLKDLTYEYDPRYPKKIAPSSFRQLLSRSLPTLSSLTFPMECIVQVTALICGNTPAHFLNHLTITEAKFCPMDSTKAEALYELLDSCNKLKKLVVLGWMDDALPDLADHIPPGLVTAAGTVSFVRTVISDRPISSIHFKYCPLDPILPSSFILDQPSTAMVRKVSLDCSSLLRPDILQALSQAFPHIQFLTLLFVRGYRGERCSAISDLWYPLRTSFYHLQVYHVLDVYSPRTDIDRAFTKENVECPIGRRNEPRERRHPSLKEIRLLSRFTWLWFKDEGWTCHEFPDEKFI
ncbi:hypothetical protein Clacol_004829 [Clathrus columnatus]|uniref:F-box domain-containing protein n=1 Tax=Clathrus columnatus TaxID=1419009 RepID=A0AAV5AAI9_9AGAM|nr:hypothetical protein Clacol_004829 [Clathrus columnatus]